MATNFADLLRQLQEEGRTPRDQHGINRPPSFGSRRAFKPSPVEFSFLNGNRLTDEILRRGIAPGRPGGFDSSNDNDGTSFEPGEGNPVPGEDTFFGIPSAIDDFAGRQTPGGVVGKTALGFAGLLSGLPFGAAKSLFDLAFGDQSVDDAASDLFGGDIDNPDNPGFDPGIDDGFGGDGSPDPDPDPDPDSEFSDDKDFADADDSFDGGQSQDDAESGDAF